MRKIQPELAEIKKNCKGNRQLESLQMMDLYKRNNMVLQVIHLEKHHEVYTDIL